MKTALEPYVIDFLLWRGYKYFSIQTRGCQNQPECVFLKPCFVKPDDEDVENEYVDILKRNYVVERHGHQEWMWTSIPDYEVAALRRWQIRHFTNCLIQN